MFWKCFVFQIKKTFHIFIDFNFATKYYLMELENGLTGLKTLDGKEILSQEYIDKLRTEESSKKNSNYFIAQKGAQEYGLSSTVDITVFGGNRGGGKANPYSTPVATPSGFRKMGDLETGDLICTPYNGIQQVSEIFEQGENTVYVLHFDDGTTVTCMDNHRFWARTDPAEDFHEMTAREIFDRYKMDVPFPLSLRRGVKNFVEIPLCGEVKMNEKVTAVDLPIHPFLLGFISGTGFWNFALSGVKLTKNTFLARKFNFMGYKIRKNRKEGFYYLRGLADENRRKITCSRQEQPARIPLEYKTASVNSRWEYLRGVMYTNGRSQHKHPYIALPNRGLIEDIAEVARSLGIWVKVTQVDDIPDKMGFWRAAFVAPNDADLFARTNFKARAHVNAEVPKKPNAKNVLTKKLQYITKSKHRQECRCITVTGRDHLYMTDGYTINHNTVTMLMEPMYDIRNKHFNGIIFRKNKDDFENIINESKRWFSSLGRYNKSKDDMTWNFKTGAKLGLTIYDMPMTDFDTKYRGQQFAYIGIDELPQMPFEMFKFLMTSNRNTVGVHSRILGTCNPDPLSWLRKFVDWWIGKEDTVYSDGMMHPERKGFAIPERDGVVRYCYMPDDSVDNIIWGDTPEEVYGQCREMIDDAWDEEWAQYGYTKTSFFVKSVTFIRASLKDNKALLKNDPGYIASLLNQPPEIRAREFDGNWDIVRMGDDTIQAYHLDKVFQNAQMLEDNVRRATCDVAGTGGDNCVTWFWIGHHVADLYVCRRDPFTTASLLKAKLQEWGVLEQNFTYDLNGMGQVLKGVFPQAIPFNNQEAVAAKDKHLYDNIKSQCAYKFAERTQQTGWSIEPTLLKQRHKVGKETKSLYDILQLERKCVKQDMSKQDKGWCLIHKEQMKNKAVVGHSPDFFEALFMREIFDIKHTQAVVPSWLQKRSGIRSVRKFTTRHN